MVATHWEMPPLPLFLCLAVCLLPGTIAPQVPEQTEIGEMGVHPYSTIMAKTGLVPRSTLPVPLPSFDSRPSDPGIRHQDSPQYFAFVPKGLAP